nr:MAG TPA: hypothetical protein [Caudoviricetes sp.]
MLDIQRLEWNIYIVHYYTVLCCESQWKYNRNP